MLFINSFKNAQQAFEMLYDVINDTVKDYKGTKSTYDLGFEITNPEDNEINTSWRKWNKTYADYEWLWY